MSSILRVVIFNILLLFCAFSPAFDDYGYAEDSKRVNPKDDLSLGGNSVAERSRPSYSPDGLYLYNFHVLPSFTSGLHYDSNVYADNTAQADWYFKNIIDLTVRSDWGRNLLEINLSLDDYRYLEHGSESRTDIKSLINTRFDIAQDIQWHNTFSYKKIHEKPEDTDSMGVRIDKPVSQRSLGVNTSLDYYRGSSGKSRFTADIQTHDYRDAVSVDGLILDQDYRDHTSYKIGTDHILIVSPGYGFLTGIEGNIKRYQNAAGAQQRNSRGYKIYAGLQFGFTDIVSANFSIGQQYQDFEDPSVSDVYDTYLYASMLWNPTRLMSVNISMERKISDASTLNAIGKIDTLMTASLDYEILRNVIGSLKADYLLEEYQGLPRTDRNFSTSFNLKYLLDKNYSLDAYVQFKQRNSDDDNFDFEKTAIGSNIKISF